MANRTDTQADTIHGTNPQYLVDRIIRVKIYNDAYWKEFCFGLTTESFIDRAAEIDYVGGTYGGRRRPAKFLCLFLKMLQIQPDEDVIMEYIKQADFKYLRALGAAYLRISARPMKVYQTLEPLFADYRKLRFRNIQGKLSLIHMDEFIDWLLREETVCDVTMPRIPKREILEETLQFPPRQSVLQDDLDELDELIEAGTPAKPAEPAQPAGAPSDTARAAPSDAAPPPAPQMRQSPSPTKQRPRRSPSPRRRSKSRPNESRHHSRSRSRSRRVARQRSRSRSNQSRDKKGKEKKRDKGKEALQNDKKEKKEKKEKAKAAKEEKDRRDKDKAKSGAGSNKEKDGLSAEQWDSIRKDLGLKPLKK